MSNCKVIAVANQKGGVGKTTTTVNLGVGLVGYGKKVLLIDADPQGSLTISLGYRNPDELDITLANLMRSVVADEKIPDGMGILRHPEGVFFAPSNIELSGVETGLVSIMSREFVLKDYVEKQKEIFDYILIDCMPSLGMLTINSLVAADSLIVPTQPSFLSAKGLNLLLSTVGRVKRNINPNLTIDGILLTMVDSRTLNARSIIDSLRSTMGQSINIFDTQIPFSVRAAESSVLGKSIYLHDPDGKVANAYRKLTEEVMCLEERSKDRPRDDGAR